MKTTITALAAAASIPSAIGSRADQKQQQQQHPFDSSSAMPNVFEPLAAPMPDHPAFASAGASERKCYYDEPYGCSDSGYCWTSCGEPGDGKWCWTATEGGDGPWATCKSWVDCQDSAIACSKTEQCDCKK